MRNDKYKQYHYNLIFILIITAFLLVLPGCGELQDAYTNNADEISGQSCDASDCHISTPLGQYPPSSGKHSAHIDLPSITCSTCHYNYNDNPMHKNSIINGYDALGETQMPGDIVHFTTILPEAAWDNGTSTCSDILCHANANWYDNVETGCGFCHGPGSQYDPLTMNATGSEGKHEAHVSNSSLSCETCHNDYTSNPLHRNGELNTDDSSSIIAFSNGSGVWDNTASTCSSLTCHGDVNWYTSTDMGCTFCHGPGNSYDPLSKGKHSEHLSTEHATLDDMDCETCHNEYKDNPLHRNGTLNSTDSSLIINFKSGIGTWDNSGSTCSSLECHGNAPWTGTATLSCRSCHSSIFSTYYPDPVGTFQGRHSSHVLSHGYACTNCHYTYTEEESHLNGRNDCIDDIINLVIFDNPETYMMDWNDSNNSCGRSGLGCHDKLAPGWDSKFW